MKIEVGNCPGLPEEIITSIVKLEDGNFAVSYSDGEYTGTLSTFNWMQCGDVKELLARRPELLAIVVESIETAEEAEVVPATAEQEQLEAPVISPTVAINVQGERYYLAVSPLSHGAFDQCWKEKFRAARFKKGTALPTTEEVMAWSLKQCNVRKQEDGSWSLPPRVTIAILEDHLYFDIVKARPVAPKIDPLIKSHIDANRNISGY